MSEAHASPARSASAIARSLKLGRSHQTMKRLSLKASIVFGAILWTIGLFTIAGIFHDTLHGTVPEDPHWSFLLLRVPLGIVIVASACMVFGLLLVRRWMLPINQLRSRLVAVHKGIDNRVLGSYPTEVQPLVDDLNALLTERDKRIARAVAKAGDLAHGLKTPLAVLVYDAEQVRSVGYAELAADIEQQVDRMQRQVEYHLAHAQSAAAAASGSTRASIVQAVNGLIGALQRLYPDKNLHVDIGIPASLGFRGQPEDLDDMLGNLLDNAYKWARSRIKVSCLTEENRIVVIVDDDGPGIDPPLRETITRRGVRADEASPGSGLGLGIVRDLTEIYNGSISFEDSPLGGARARLVLPTQTSCM